MTKSQFCESTISCTEQKHDSLYDSGNRYRIGEAFVHLPLDKAQERLASDQERVQTELSGLQHAADECKSVMQDLKLHLYSKFGSSINLD